MNTTTRLLVTGLVWGFTATSVLGADDTANKKADAKCNHPGPERVNLFETPACRN